MSVQLRAVCESCERRSRWQDEDPECPGRLFMWGMARGWSVVPYAPDFEHPDGTHGDKWICPRCVRRASYRALIVECTERRVVAATVA